MLRTPRCRLSATKFLDRRLPRSAQHAAKLAKEGRVYLSPYNYEISLGKVLLGDHENQLPDWYLNEKVMLETLQTDESQEAYFFFYYPNKERLVNNALLAGLSIDGQDIYTNRAVFDFLNSHMPITSPINSFEESVNIVEGALLTLVKKDFASLKKFHTWFLGHIDDASGVPVESDPAINFVTSALKTILWKFTSVKTDQKVVINRMGIQERSLWTINTPIQIMINLLSDNSAIMEPILSAISVDLLNYIRYFSKENQIDTQTVEKFKTYVVNLFQMIISELGWGWMQLCNLLNDEIQRIEHGKIVSIDLITFVLKDL